MIESHKCWNRARWVSINLFQFVCLHTEVCISHTKAHTNKKKPVHITLEKLHFKYDISSVIFSLSLFFSLTLSFPYSIALSELIRMNISLYFHIQKTRMETGHDFYSSIWITWAFYRWWYGLSSMIHWKIPAIRWSFSSALWKIHGIFFFIFIITYHYGELNAKCKSIFTMHFSPEIHIRKCCLYVNFWSSLRRNTNIFHQIAYVIFSYWFNIFIHQLVRILYIFCFCIPTTHGAWNFFYFALSICIYFMN